MSKHSTGPWRVFDRTLNGRCQFVIVDGGGAPVAGVDHRADVLAGFGKDNDARSLSAEGQPEAWANAEFIVRAVNCHEEMLDVLRVELDRDGHVHDCGNGGDDPDDCSPRCARINAAIKNATGGDQ